MAEPSNPEKIYAVLFCFIFSVLITASFSGFRCHLKQNCWWSHFSQRCLGVTLHCIITHFPLFRAEHQWPIWHINNSSKENHCLTVMKQEAFLTLMFRVCSTSSGEECLWENLLSSDFLRHLVQWSRKGTLSLQLSSLLFLCAMCHPVALLYLKCPWPLHDRKCQAHIISWRVRLMVPNEMGGKSLFFKQYILLYWDEGVLQQRSITRCSLQCHCDFCIMESCCDHQWFDFRFTVTEQAVVLHFKGQQD